MRNGVAAFVRRLDPRLKLGLAMALGPGLWLLQPAFVAGAGVLLLIVLYSLSASQPLGGRMIRSMFLFVLIWMGIKMALDAWSGIPPASFVVDGGVIGLRLSALLMLGLCLAHSSSPRSLGLALSWVFRPLVGAERAWKFALSLALMVHFLPLTLSAMAQVNESLSRRCPKAGFGERMRIIPPAVLRNLGQKTWSQTLVVAGRGLENATAWQPDFVWSSADSFVLVLSLLTACLIFVA